MGRYGSFWKLWTCSFIALGAAALQPRSAGAADVASVDLAGETFSSNAPETAQLYMIAENCRSGATNNGPNENLYVQMCLERGQAQIDELKVRLHPGAEALQVAYNKIVADIQAPASKFFAELTDLKKAASQASKQDAVYQAEPTLAGISRGKFNFADKVYVANQHAIAAHRQLTTNWDTAGYNAKVQSVKEVMGVQYQIAAAIEPYLKRLEDAKDNPKKQELAKLYRELNPAREKLWSQWLPLAKQKVGLMQAGKSSGQMDWEKINGVTAQMEAVVLKYRREMNTRMRRIDELTRLISGECRILGAVCNPLPSPSPSASATASTGPADAGLGIGLGGLSIPASATVDAVSIQPAPNPSAGALKTSPAK